jgi:hypothetical protein
MNNADIRLTAFRGHIRRLIEREARGRNRNIVILGLDGIPYDIAAMHWPKADVRPMTSVFPTTSSTGWLSSLTGAEVRQHGIPGVVFKLAEAGGQLVNVFSYKGQLVHEATGNIFSDAAAHGYQPIAVLGDLEPLPCTWRDILLEGSQRIEGHRFYTAAEETPAALRRALTDAIAAASAASDPSRPRLVWCFIDCDLRIHRTGYDDEVLQFLGHVEGIAAELLQQDTVVVAHSDHGLTRTRHDDRVASTIEQATTDYGCLMGGAGRTRWLYPRSGTCTSLLNYLKQQMPPSVFVYHTLRPHDSLVAPRAGEILLVAQGEDFITQDGYTFDHGSLTAAELTVPVAEWHG